jgi:hypothetical protein
MRRCRESVRREKMRRLDVCDKNMREKTSIGRLNLTTCGPMMHHPMQHTISHLGMRLGVSWNLSMREVCTTFRDLAWDFDVGSVHSKKQCTHIERVIANGSTVSKATVYNDAALECVAMAFGRTLKEFKICFCNITDLGVLKTCRSLETLTVSCCRNLIDWSAVWMVRATLRDLSLCNVGDEPIALPTDWSMYHEMQTMTLEMQTMPLETSGIVHIHALPPSLIKIVLRYLSIPSLPAMPKTMQHIELEMCPHLTELPDLEHCHGLDHVEIDDLCNLRNFGHLWKRADAISHCRVDCCYSKEDYFDGED